MNIIKVNSFLRTIGYELKKLKGSVPIKRVTTYSVHLPKLSERNANKQLVEKKILTIICVTYKRQEALLILIHSLLAQSLMNFKLIIIHDGYDKLTDELLEPYKSKYSDFFDYFFTDTRFNDYGHSLRDMGIKMADTEYILITNDDNYYAPKFVEYMFSSINLDNEYKHPDIIFCDMIHSHNNPGLRNQLPYNYFVTEPMRYFIDIGCFIAKTELAKKVGFRDKSFTGDATYFEDIVSSVKKPFILKIPMVLLMHN